MNVNTFLSGKIEQLEVVLEVEEKKNVHSNWSYIGPN